METLRSVWEWAKADWQHDWESGDAYLGLAFVPVIWFILFLWNRKKWTKEFMKGFRGEE
jgi:hypothetical protein